VIARELVKPGPSAWSGTSSPRANTVELPFSVVFCCFRLLHAHDFMDMQTTYSARLTLSVFGRCLLSGHAPASWFHRGA